MRRYGATPRGKSTNRKTVDTLRQKRQAMLNAYKQTIGCAICAAKTGQLHFHHIDPNTRIDSVSAPEIMGSLDKLVKEIEKCLVMCPECHTEWHRENRLPEVLVL